MTIRVTCPNPGCGASAGVEEQSLGRRGRCKRCGHVFALARAGGPAGSTPSADASAWKGAAPSRPAPGGPDLPEQFGRYRILRPIGQGGMGAVYLAHDTVLDRRVALKVPSFGEAGDDQAIQRFRREARAAATLDHPHLCPVFDVGTVDGVHYLTMPYIEGKPLSEALAPGVMVPEAQAAAMVRKLALALGEAHDRGVVHRDLKPGNIMVNRRRDLIIMDFGLARVADGDDRAITRTGHVLGTALYMAPEQAAGHGDAIGPAVDIYSLGVILYEMVAGVRPFEGPWSLVIGLKNVKDPDPPSTHCPGLSPGLDAICRQALARDPRDRFASMAEFAAALASHLVAPAPALMPDALPAEVTGGDTSPPGEVSAAAPPHPSRFGKFPIRRVAVAAALVPLLGILHVASDTGRSGIPSAGPGAAPGRDLPAARDRFEAFGGRWSLEAGELVQADEAETTAALMFGDERWTDYDFTAEARRTSGMGSFSLHFRGEGPDNSYAYVVSGRFGNSCFVEDHRDGGLFPLPFPDGSPLVLDNDRWYTARVSVRGGQVRCSVRDGGRSIDLPEIVDDRRATGRVGLRTWGSSYRFRDIKVTDPDGRVLWEGPPAIPAPAAPEPDRLQAGSVWRGERTYPANIYKGVTVSYSLHVRERDGAQFRGNVFDNGVNRNYVEVEGRVEGDAVTWSERLKDGRVIWTIRGTLAGDEIRLKLAALYERGLRDPGVGHLTRE